MNNARDIDNRDQSAQIYMLEERCKALQRKVAELTRICEERAEAFEQLQAELDILRAKLE